MWGEGDGVWGGGSAGGSGGSGVWGNRGPDRDSRCGSNGVSANNFSIFIRDIVLVTAATTVITSITTTTTTTITFTAALINIYPVNIT